MADDRRGDPERPDYKVYRSRPGLLSRLRSSDLSKVREKRPGKKGDGDGDERRTRRPATALPLWRRVLRWTGVFALVWIVLSFLAFEISSQIQKGKLSDMGNTLHGNPFMAASPQTILVIGTDIRSGEFAGANEAESKSCLKTVESGKPNGPTCKHGPYRSDTLMLVRAGGGDFRKLSIPRDTLAQIPGQPENKINSAYAVGGAKLTVRTIEKFLGINIDQVAIVDFDGFRRFIDSIGGVTVNVPTTVCSTISGAFTLQLNKGEHTLNGFQAIALARTRENNLPAALPSGTKLRKFCQSPPPITDINRTQFQQAILNGVKDRLTDPLRAPYNIVKGPFIGWDAPQVMVSSMGAWTMPQLVFAAGIGFSNGSDVLKPTGLPTAAGNLIIPPSECDRAVKKFLGSSPPHKPACSPPS
jgi:LCP family protein required for cell wall assembly